MKVCELFTECVGKEGPSFFDDAGEQDAKRHGLDAVGVVVSWQEISRRHKARLDRYWSCRTVCIETGQSRCVREAASHCQGSLTQIPTGNM